MNIKFGCKSCNHCAVCCKGWDIELSKEDIRNLVSLGYNIRDFLDVKPNPKMKLVGKQKNCIFLDEKNMCIIEKKHGHESKPHTCKHYPHISKEKIKEKDYFFYRYKDKVFSRDVLIKMLDKIKDSDPTMMFESFLHELERLPQHEDDYIDVFNYQENLKPSTLSKIFVRPKIEDLVSLKFGKEEREFFEKIEKRKKFSVKKFIEEIKKRIPTSEAINPNLPEMLLAYFYFIRRQEPKHEKKLAEYFFEWNGKRF
ncbi:MAG: YkgJ family cysteine cluster protein [Candidatus Aenigmatarchaeota archaeon]